MYTVQCTQDILRPTQDTALHCAQGTKKKQNTALYTEHPTQNNALYNCSSIKTSIMNVVGKTNLFLTQIELF